MAEQPKTDEQAPAKKMPIKTIALVAAVLLIEGVVISAAFVLSGGPANVRADNGLNSIIDDGETEVEELVVADKFDNSRQGRVYLYDTEVYIVVRKKHQAKVQDQLKQMNARITSEIRTIFRRAEPSDLLAPDRATISRQIKALLDEMLGGDEESNSRVMKVIVSKCTQFRI